MSKTKWTAIGQIRKNKNGNMYVAFRKGVEIRLDGELVDLGEYGTNAKVFDAEAGLVNQLNSGKLTQEDYDKELDFIKSKNVVKRISVVSEG